MADDLQEPPIDPGGKPDSGQKPPKLSPAFLLLWIIGILVFVVLAGCTLMIFAFSLETPSLIGTVLGSSVMLGGLYWFLQALRKARQAERGQEPPNRVLLYGLLIPIVASFIWAGGCLLSFSNF